MLQRRGMALVVMVVVAGAVVAGCGGARRKSSLLLEREARGPVGAHEAAQKPTMLLLEPQTQTLTKDGVEVTVTHASHAYLDGYFHNKEIFGDEANSSPYFPVHLVLYVRVANHSGKKIHVDPDAFVLVDDVSSQYQPLSPDHITALAEYLSPIATFTRTTLEEARPGYFGLSAPVGKMFAPFVGSERQRFALLKLVTMIPTYLYDGVIYDGFVAFWQPHRSAKQLRVIVANVKSNFDAKDEPKTTTDFEFLFTIKEVEVPAKAKRPAGDR